MNRQLFNAMLVQQYGKQTVKGADKVEWSTDVHCNLPSLKIFGESKYAGGINPTPDSPVEILSNSGMFIAGKENEWNGVFGDLRGIGDYKDEWDFVTGKGLRYIHKVELDGVSEYRKFKRRSSEGRCDIDPEFTPAQTGSNCILSTHFEPRQGFTRGYCFIRKNPSTLAYELCLAVGEGTFANVEAANAWLAEQHANGTPVIIYYVLAEPQEFYKQGGTISNDSGRVYYGDGTLGSSTFEITYITQAGEFERVKVSSTDANITWSGGISNYSLPSLKIYGKCEQDGTPTPEAPISIKELIGTFKENNTGITFVTPELRSISRYKDEWDYVTGKGLQYIHKVELDGVSEGKKVFKVNTTANSTTVYGVVGLDFAGREATILSTHFIARQKIEHGCVYITSSGVYAKRALVMTHLDLDTVDKWNTWLAERYAAGTPVTVYYALLEPLPFTAQGGVLPNERGKITQTDGSVIASGLEAVYVKKR